jgi:hypothetical protein
MNYLEILQMIRSGRNPQEIAMSFLESNYSNTPLGNNLIAMAKRKDSAGIEQVVRNIAQSRGIDFDKEFTAFRQLLGL